MEIWAAKTIPCQNLVGISPINYHQWLHGPEMLRGELGSVLFPTANHTFSQTLTRMATIRNPLLTPPLVLVVLIDVISPQVTILLR